MVLEREGGKRESGRGGTARDRERERETLNTTTATTDKYYDDDNDHSTNLTLHNSSCLAGHLLHSRSDRQLIRLNSPSDTKSQHKNIRWNSCLRAVELNAVVHHCYLH